MLQFARVPLIAFKSVIFIVEVCGRSTVWPLQAVQACNAYALSAQQHVQS